jgi:hypothetical protein
MNERDAWVMALLGGAIFALWLVSGLIQWLTTTS